MEASQAHFPINSLAVEVLCQIFLLCCEVQLPGRADRRVHAEINATQASDPMVLTHVSKHWRAVAIHLGPLWNFIKITRNTTLGKSSIWLERSGNHPLDIVIIEILPDDVAASYDLLSLHTHRWRSFYILGDVSPPSRASDWRLVPFVKTFKGNSPPTLIAPMLRVLYVRTRSHRNHLEEFFSPKYLSFESSSLTRLVLININLGWEQLSTTLSHITDFEVSELRHGPAYTLALMRVIGQMTSLRHLRAVLLGFGPIETIEHTMVLPDLQTANMFISGRCCLPWVWLTNLKAPRLWQFHILHTGRSYDITDLDWHEEQSRNEWATLLDAIQLPSLTDFVWGPDRTVPCSSTLAAFIRAIPTVVSITVDFRQALYPPSTLFSFDCVCPRLERVHFKRLQLRDDCTHKLLGEAIARLNPKAVITYDDEM